MEFGQNLRDFFGKQLFDLDRYVKEVLPYAEKVPIKKVAAETGVPVAMLEECALKQIHKDIALGLDEVEISDKNAIDLSEVRELFTWGQGDDVTGVVAHVTKQQRKKAKRLYDEGWSYIKIAKEMRIKLTTTKFVMLSEGVDVTKRF